MSPILSGSYFMLKSMVNLRGSNPENLHITRWLFQFLFFFYPENLGNDPI